MAYVETPFLFRIVLSNYSNKQEVVILIILLESNGFKLNQMESGGRIFYHYLLQVVIRLFISCSNSALF